MYTRHHIRVTKIYEFKNKLLFSVCHKCLPFNTVYGSNASNIRFFPLTIFCHINNMGGKSSFLNANVFLPDVCQLMSNVGTLSDRENVLHQIVAVHRRLCLKL